MTTGCGGSGKWGSESESEEAESRVGEGMGEREGGNRDGNGDPLLAGKWPATSSHAGGAGSGREGASEAAETGPDEVEGRVEGRGRRVVRLEWEPA